VHVILAVDDVPRAVEFYERVFGWPRNERIDFSNYVELHGDGGTLGLYEREGFAAASGAIPADVPAGGQTATELYVRVDDVAPLVERLRDAGARELRGLTTKVWGDDAAYFEDPDGNVVAVAQHTR
jgi:catechol 2,3-dioxygenase-like lactoylglutathione lyase family enzyme